VKYSVFYCDSKGFSSSLSKRGLRLPEVLALLSGALKLPERKDSSISSKAVLRIMPGKVPQATSRKCLQCKAKLMPKLYTEGKTVQWKLKGSQFP